MASKQSQQLVALYKDWRTRRQPGPRVVLLGQQADVVAQRQQPLEQSAAPRRAGPAGAR